MGRDRGRGKAGGRGGRGGGGKKMYIANVEELEKREREGGPGGEDDEEDEEESEEEEETAGKEATKDAEATVFAFERKSRAELAAERGEAPAAADDGGVSGLLGGLSVNPNRAKKPVEKMIKVKNVNDAVAADPDAGMNRKEREQLAALKAKEDYQRRHMAGETEQAKRELAQLAMVRARREAAAKQREQEGRAPGWTQAGIEESEGSSSEDDDSDGEATKGPKPVAAPKPAPVAAIPPSIAKKMAAAEAAEAVESAADGGPPKLKAMDIKKMNGDALKDHLKERNLETQGQKKDLMKRLMDYEAARP